MTRAKIVNGRWTRRVGKEWIKDGGAGRTDIFKTVLADSRLREAAFVMANQTVIVPVDDLRRALIGAPDRYGGKIWGPFDIDPQRSTVYGRKVKMQVVAN